MGERQALYANLEAGAQTIREFQMTFVPGLLQTAGFTHARVDAEGGAGASVITAEKAIEARIGRQRMLRRPGGPSYEVILDELAIRRVAAPPEVVKAQLYHVAATANGSPKITVRVLPVDAVIGGYAVPRSAFSIYTFTDPDDPTVVAVDTVTEDITLTERDDVKRYEELFDRLREATLPIDQGLELLITTAKTMSTAVPAASAASA
jgi:hypothetical protein